MPSRSIWWNRRERRSFDILRWNPRPVVRDLDQDPAPVVEERPQADGRRLPPFQRLEGVEEKIDQNLLKELGVALEFERLRLDLDGEADVTSGHVGVHQTSDPVEKLGDGEHMHGRLGQKGERAEGLDEMEEPAAALLDRPGRFLDVLAAFALPGFFALRGFLGDQVADGRRQGGNRSDRIHDLMGDNPISVCQASISFSSSSRWMLWIETSLYWRPPSLNSAARRARVKGSFSSASLTKAFS